MMAPTSALIILFLATQASAQIRPQVTPKTKKPATTKSAKQPAGTEAELPKAEQPPAPQSGGNSKPAKIVVETSPAAEVYLDDRFVGRTSSDGRLVIEETQAGSHTLRISLAGKRDHSEPVTLQGDEERTIKATLVDLASILSVRAAPGAQVFLNEISRGRIDKSGNLTIAEVTPGTYRVKVSALGMQDWKRAIILHAGEKLDIGPELKEASGAMALKAPAGAEVFLNGTSRGKTDATGRFEIGDLPPGSYRLHLAQKGYQEWEQMVTVGPGSSVFVAAEMQPKEISYALHGTLTGHEKPILALAFSPDSIWLVSGSLDGSVRLWDVPRGAAIRDVISINKDAPEDVYSIAFSPDGRLLATGQRRLWWRNQIRFWTVGPWTETKVDGIVRTIYSRVSSLTFSHDGRFLAAHIDDDVRLWEIASGREILKLDAPIKIKVGQYVLGAIAFSPDDTLLAAGGRDVIVWKMPQGAALYKIPEQMKSLAFSPDGRMLALTGRTLSLRDAQNAREIRAFACGGEVGAVAFSPDGLTVAGGCADGVVKLWDVSSGKELRSLLRHAGSVSVLTFSKDGRWLASAGVDNAIKLWRLQE